MRINKETFIRAFIGASVGMLRELPLMPGWNMVEPPLWLRLLLQHKAGYQHFRGKRVWRGKRMITMDTDDF